MGKGLGALIPDSNLDSSVPIEIDIDQIKPNPFQPRSHMDEKSLDELAVSIRENGILQPILVRPLGPDYQLVAGERRLSAAQRAGFLQVPAVVRDVPDEKLLELALVENIQREQLNPVEEAHAYRSLLSNLEITQESLSARLGKERSTIANSIRLLKLPPKVLGHVADGKLSPGHARALLASGASAGEMAQRASQIIEKAWSVRETERWAKGRGEIPVRHKPTDPDVEAAADRLRLILGTKVEIRGGRDPKKTGQIRIHYHSQEDLMRIYDVISGRGALIQEA